MDDDSVSSRTYSVVVNAEEQYSIWPTDREIPAGWRAIDVTGTREDCLAHIKEIWTDMRPLSVRRHLRQTQDLPEPSSAEI